MPTGGSVSVRRMQAADLPFGVHLKDQAGWNQTTADIERFLALEPDGCFVAEFNGQPAGTVAAFVFGPVAWIAFVLVESGLRGQGIGQALMRQSLEFIDGRQVPTARLDATPLGQPLYEKLGFVSEYQLARFEGRPSPPPTPANVLPGGPEHFAAIVELDRRASGAERSKLLQRLIDEQPAQLRIVVDQTGVTGFSLTRPGSRATMIGPCVAENSNAGLALLADALRRHAGENVFVDIPLDQPAALALARQCGLTVQRELLRMRRGPALVENPGMLWASSGPEKG